jgi:hypothetical protein
MFRCELNKCVAGNPTLTQKTSHSPTHPPTHLDRAQPKPVLQLPPEIPYQCLHALVGIPIAHSISCCAAQPVKEVALLHGRCAACIGRAWATEPRSKSRLDRRQRTMHAHMPCPPNTHRHPT